MSKREYIDSVNEFSEYAVQLYIGGVYEDPEYRTKEAEEYLHKSVENFGYEDCMRYAHHVWETECVSGSETKVEIDVVKEVPLIDDHGEIDFNGTESIDVICAEYNPASSNCSGW